MRRGERERGEPGTVAKRPRGKKKKKDKRAK